MYLLPANLDNLDNRYEVVQIRTAFCFVWKLLYVAKVRILYSGQQYSSSTSAC